MDFQLTRQSMAEQLKPTNTAGAYSISAHILPTALLTRNIVGRVACSRRNLNHHQQNAFNSVGASCARPHISTNPLNRNNSIVGEDIILPLELVGIDMLANVLLVVV